MDAGGPYRGAVGLQAKPFYRYPKFRRWLASMPPGDELVIRTAFRDLIRHRGFGRKWEVRIAKLEWELIHTSDDTAELLADVMRAKGQIAKIIEAGLK
jgi:hypothetical protein